MEEKLQNPGKNFVAREIQRMDEQSEVNFVLANGPTEAIGGRGEKERRYEIVFAAFSSISVEPLSLSLSRLIPFGR